MHVGARTMTLFERVVRLLSERQVSHALIGAAALAARGIARSTFDIDLLTTDARVLDRALWSALAESGVGVDIRRGDADDPLAGVIRIETPDERPVDVIVGKHGWQARAIERAERAPDGPPVVAARDLVLLKLYAGGTQDLWDVRELIQLPDADRLIAEVTTDLADQPGAMRALWADVRR